MKRVVALIVSCLMLFPPLSLATDVVMPGLTRSDYFTELLALSLSYHPDKNYQVKFIEYDVPKLRAFKLIEANQGIDVIAAGATVDRQAVLQSVKIPLLKGLFGWRVALVHESNLTIMKDTNRWDEFKQLSAGQLRTWSDVRILQSNGINVVKGANYQGLFDMLHNQRFDYFPRSILEIHSELNNHRHYDIAIEPHILLHYPTAYYFYVNKQNFTLAQDIEVGLELAIKEGRFEDLFQRHYGKIIAEFQAQNRRVIELNNPMLPHDVPLKRTELWLSLYPKL